VLEKVLRVQISHGTVEFKNISGKAITVYLFTFTTTRGGRTEFYSGTGRDFLSDGQLKLAPGKTTSMELWSGKSPPRIDVYPCAIIFEDGTGLGKPQALSGYKRLRAAQAKSYDEQITILRAARDADDPKAALLKSTKWRQDRWYFKTVSERMSGEQSANRKAIDIEIVDLTWRRSMLLQGAKPDPTAPSAESGRTQTSGPPRR
jgi:hypothetical protein